MSRKDSDYYRQRAATEHALAQAAARANVREIHEELARHYEALTHEAQLRPDLSATTSA
jgi:hypothetical protein